MRRSRVPWSRSVGRVIYHPSAVEVSTIYVGPIDGQGVPSSRHCVACEAIPSSELDRRRFRLQIGSRIPAPPTRLTQPPRTRKRDVTHTVGLDALPSAGTGSMSFADRLNTSWHKLALQGFMGIVLFHWVEHIVQAYQAFVLHWPRPMAMGFLGMYFPWLMKTEVLHYGFAVIMLIGLWVLRRGFVGRSYTWWMIAFWIQFWHHIEHAQLLYQALSHHYLFGGSVPTSIGQIWIPRIEL